jgi:ParB family transcriptional regulator, chromosome partitioning protein
MLTTEKRVQSYLKDISPDRIKRNPENPRLFFRSEEIDTLMASIRRYGIQVPISVYQDDDAGYVLIDGERRWRCARKLNIPRIPALVQPKPSPLENLLLMFNIHALREQWDYLTIASKLPNVIDLFRREHGKEPNEQELGEITGLTRGQIRRCKFLLDLPEHYMGLLKEELALPKHRQTLSEDFFIEMERALKTVKARVPSAVHNINSARNALIKKFRAGVIGNITDFRKLSKIATSISNLGVKESKARAAITEILDPQSVTSIQEVFVEQFEIRYDERKMALNIDSIYEYLEVSVKGGSASVGEDLRRRLLKLKRLIEKVLEN